VIPPPAIAMEKVIRKKTLTMMEVSGSEQESRSHFFIFNPRVILGDTSSIEVKEKVTF
jgi:hypothetical protein